MCAVRRRGRVCGGVVIVVVVASWLSLEVAGRRFRIGTALVRIKISRGPFIHHHGTHTHMCRCC